jgi:hypothetical protein
VKNTSPKFLYKIKLYWSNLRFPIKIILIIILTISIGLLGYLGTNYYFNSDIALLKAPNAISKNSVTIVPPTPLPPKYSKINGIQVEYEEFDKLLDRKPLAIVVNNHKDARPQSGLSKADTVLEVLAEGGITRYVAMYHNNYDVEKIGPIRSLRYYMIDFASGYDDAMILHHGWAGFDNADFEVYNAETDARGAISKFNIKNIQTEASTYRDPQKAKTSGYVHSLYTDFTRINTEISRLSKSYNWNLGSENLKELSFKDDAVETERGMFNSVDIRFMSLGGSDYASKFTYDKTTNAYPRFIGGQPDIDQLSNKQISPKNVIIEWHEYADARDGHSRIVIKMIGENKATILRDGQVIEGKWRKQSRLDRTQYFDGEGKEIPLNRGQIWIVNAVKVQDRLISTITIQ